jgi:hypothetical protein
MMLYFLRRRRFTSSLHRLQNTASAESKNASGNSCSQRAHGWSCCIWRKAIPSCLSVVVTTDYNTPPKPCHIFLILVGKILQLCPKNTLLGHLYNNIRYALVWLVLLCVSRANITMITPPKMMTIATMPTNVMVSPANTTPKKTATNGLT